MEIVGGKIYLILLVIRLSQSFDSSAIAAEFLLQRKWDVLIGSKNKNQYYGCNGIVCVFKSQQVFITDPECYKNGLAADPNNKAYINKMNGGNPVVEANEINENDVYYNENLSKSYNNSRRMFMMMIIKHPVIFADTEDESKFISLPNSSHDVDFSKCFVPQPNGRHIKLKYCYLNNCHANQANYYCNTFRCRFNASSVFSRNIVICGLKNKPEVKVISGILSEGRNTPTIHLGAPTIEFENLSDLRNVIYEKLANLTLD